ncbi:hypothetical protein TCDM_06102 [Trypanosoma cruzi Dm28c]|uniref:Secreted peptide n=1 Tax=Trypanosoma cruzi Dm28c TaxID=1416333 RepID=V5DDJ3_TRYCR|nr:hypothetical protein TCDM_06102 [Trypanosoma cruzi Dm28c]
MHVTSLFFSVFCFGPTISATWDHNPPCHFTVLPPLFPFFVPSLSLPLLIVWVGCLFPRPAPGRGVALLAHFFCPFY